MGRLRGWAGAVLLVGCGTPGELATFASGPLPTTGEDVVPSTGVVVETSSSNGGSEASGSTSGGRAWDGDVDYVYVRCPRTTASMEISGDVVVGGETRAVTRTLGYADVYDLLPTSVGGAAAWLTGFVAPCDLVYRRASGDEEILYNCSEAPSAQGVCAAVEPAVSHDGERIAFTVVRGSIVHPSMRARPWLLDPEAEDGDDRFYDLPNPRLERVSAQIHIVELETGAVTAFAHEEGDVDSGPAFLSDGRIAFTSTRGRDLGTVVRFSGDEPWSTWPPTQAVPQLYTVSAEGDDARRLSYHGLSGEFAPFQLADGRVAHANRQLFGLSPYRSNSGTAGNSGGIGASFHLLALGPDGTLLTPLFGHHTYHYAAPNHTVAHRITEGHDGWLWYTEGGADLGAGAIYGFKPRSDFVVGPAPGPLNAAELGVMFRPPEYTAAASWAGHGGLPSAPLEGAPIFVPGYDDPMYFTGFLRDPEALPEGGLLVTWTKGYCSYIGASDVFGPDPPPGTSGSNAFASMNIHELLGLDIPGCDAGVYAMPTMPSEHPSSLERVVDTPEFHEFMARAVVPYYAVHDVERPALRFEPPPGDPHSVFDASADPFGTLQVSSILRRETRSIDGHPFGSAIQWALQGTDTVDYENAELCGVRLLAVQPNVEQDADDLRANAGHRTRVLGEIAVRNAGEDGAPALDPLGDPDTSFRLHTPAQVPYLLQGIDCEGRTLNTTQTPQALQAGERQTCTGCHVRSEPGPAFEGTATELDPARNHWIGQGTTPLLAGGSPLDVEIAEVPGWGVAFEFERDVFPILQARCASCHSGASAEAGLVLDLPGSEPGSTAWRLAADGGQVYVPDGARAPIDGDDRLRVPQLSKYVRFMNARGSLLMWKAANERLDGRTDNTHADDAEGGFADVDFGPDHPTSITAEELAVLSRWIDTGAGFGASYLHDTTRPTLAVDVEEAESGRLTLLIGTVDVGAGIDEASLEVCMTRGAGSCEVLDAPPAHEAGRIEVDLGDAGTLGDSVVVSVFDRAGNQTRVERPLRVLEDEPPEGDPDTGSSGIGGFTSVVPPEDNNDAPPQGDTRAGCSCRAPTRPGLGGYGLLLLTVLAFRPRRIDHAQSGP